MTARLLAEGIRIGRHEQQAGHAGEMQPRRLFRLGTGGKMDITILEIDGGAMKNTSLPRFMPQGFRHDLVDDCGHGLLLWR